MPRLAVVMPVKNGEPYVRRAVVSTLRAMPPDAELVLANDGSTDGTAAVIASIGDRRLKIHSWGESKGVSHALNFLIQNTDSDYVARMDADDVCLPHRFRYQRAVIGRNDCVFSNAILMSRGGIPFRTGVLGTLTADAVPLHLLTGNILVHPTMFARRTFIESLSGYRKTFAEDYDLWLRAAAQGKKIFRSSVPTILYRKHASQLSSAGSWQRPEWDPYLDAAFAELAKLLLDIDITDNSIRLERTANRPGSTNLPIEAFDAAISERAETLSAIQSRFVRFRLWMLARRRTV